MVAVDASETGSQIALLLVQSLLIQYYYTDDIRDSIVTAFVRGFRHAPDEDPSGVEWQGSGLTHYGTTLYSIRLPLRPVIWNHPSLSLYWRTECRPDAPQRRFSWRRIRAARRPAQGLSLLLSRSVKNAARGANQVLASHDVSGECVTTIPLASASQATNRWRGRPVRPQRAQWLDASGSSLMKVLVAPFGGSPFVSPRP